MNRKQRRAAVKQTSGSQTAAQLFADALRAQQHNKLDEAARAYKRLLELEPEHAQASNNLACLLHAQDRRAEASIYFARALELMPQLGAQFLNICNTLVSLVPPLGDAMQRANAAWPRRLPLDAVVSREDFAAIVADPLLSTTLKSIPVRNVALERLLTTLRAALLADVSAMRTSAALAFGCALAQQCFINEYVFATTPDEDNFAETIKSDLREVSPEQLIALAMYVPLHALPDARALLERKWPDAVGEVLEQQVREPLAEQALRASIPHLTPIEDTTSQRVRQMYEENPYPRWVRGPAKVTPRPIDQYLRAMFPTAAFAPLDKTDGLDVLVAGCGTGWHAIAIASALQGAQVTAIDLSLASLGYAKRKTPAALPIEYAQADILKLGGIERRFDVVDASGVLHHMADLFAGWRLLLSLLRPNGVMHLGLYSEFGRADIVDGRAFIAERGYGSSAAEIRRCRQDLLATPLARLARLSDFFTTSECRDMLFHVQESRTTIPAIKAFLAEQKLKFIGFEFGEAEMRGHRAHFAERGWSSGDLDRWHEFEAKYPDTFAGMYHFWVQKS